jgi:hypothetical protein
MKEQNAARSERIDVPIFDHLIFRRKQRTELLLYRIFVHVYALKINFVFCQTQFYIIVMFALLIGKHGNYYYYYYYYYYYLQMSDLDGPWMYPVRCDKG